MKKMGRQMRMEKTSTTTAKRGMARREKEKRFMTIPPSSIPRAAAGRFTAPARNGAIRAALPAQNPSMGRGKLSGPHRSWENLQIQRSPRQRESHQGEPQVSSKDILSVTSSPGFKKLGEYGLPADGYFLPPSLLTYEEVGLGGGGTVLLLQEFVEEGGQTRNDGGEAALSQHQEDEEGVEQQPEEDPWESYRETVGKMSFSRVILMPTTCTGKKPPPLACSQ